jgi:hypothetical protein
MNDRSCPCGTRLDRSSAVRSLILPCLRMFMSIRTMQSLTSDTKICNVCRHLYTKWKKENFEFGTILNRLESDMVDAIWNQNFQTFPHSREKRISKAEICSYQLVIYI